jgi:vacuolar-type H+-ATPase subunit H
MRFRRYLGTQYSSDENCELREDDLVPRRHALPIYSIYFLGHALDHFPNVPVIRVARNYIDAATGAELTERDEFIEALTHDSVVIQVPYLRAQRRNRLETLLSVFDQGLTVPGNAHELDLREEDFPEELRPVVRRLLRAISEKTVRDQMTVQDEVLEELEQRERIAQQALRQLQEERRQKEEAIGRAAEERRQKEEERRQKEAAIGREQRLRELLRRQGLSDDDIDQDAERTS